MGRSKKYNMIIYNKLKQQKKHSQIYDNMPAKLVIYSHSHCHKLYCSNLWYQWNVICTRTELCAEIKYATRDIGRSQLTFH